MRVFALVGIRVGFVEIHGKLGFIGRGPGRCLMVGRGHRGTVTVR